MNVSARGDLDAHPRLSFRHDEGMKFYRSHIASGEFEYARVHGNSGRADYFDDELRIWIGDDRLRSEIAEDGIWVACSAAEALDAAEAWPGMTFDVSRVLAG